MRNYIIVAPYGYKELDAICQNESKKLPLIYLGDAIAREPVEDEKQSYYELLYCEEGDYTEDDKIYFCRSLADQALTLLIKANTVFVVMPDTIKKCFMEQLAIARHESKGDVLTPKCSVLSERFEMNHSFNPDHVFLIHFTVKKARWLATICRHFLPQRPDAGDLPKPEQSPDTVSVEYEGIYHVLRTGDYSGLGSLSKSELDWLKQRSLSDQEYELAAKIRDAQSKK